MFFKNAIFYRFTAKAPMLEEEALVENAFTPCGRQDDTKCGWGAPSSAEDCLVSHHSRVSLICMVREEKILPASVIREKLDAKVKEIEHQEDRRVYRKEKDTLKEEILFDCLPQAFTKKAKTYAYIDYKSQMLVIDASAYARAEELMKLLRDSLGSLPVVPAQVSESPSVMMTGWLRGDEMPEDMELGDQCELREQCEDGSIIRCKKQELLSEEIEPHLNAGKQAVALELNYDDKVTFRLTDTLQFKQLKFGDLILSESRDSADGDKKLEHYSDLLLMSDALRSLFEVISTAFGGDRKEAA
ncbi:MAG: recombination-associated protein RdgC [Cellvibrionaceae bacterium]